ncbi:oxidoreductase-like protein [Protomyces lactucae-debilis]|uniref:Oxidoreductase-like protein n=1 Tax=Protomyces lactucae-debilis TaxID=2754530 RepID=A0A1Y2EPB7_PROLT|nr:oxidoreductase-like protein [Protomyces lactucae-debilis]ORY73389.1 oxidoreductase-like protein [Protomyces lactucae-debilis]
MSNIKDGQFSAQDIGDQHQSSTTTGLEKEMKPSSESTKLESPEGMREYTPANKLHGRSALITGGDSGIGRAVAVLYAREGCHKISIVYLEEEQEDAEETKRMVEKEGGTCLLMPFDLTHFKETKHLIDKHMETYGHLNILVNNASKQISCKHVADLDLDMVESTFASNILQMIALTKFAVPHMKRGDVILNTTSVTAYRGSGQFLDYAATKGAIVSFTRGLASQLTGETGIRVNAVAPGPVHTPLQPASRPAEQMSSFGEGTMFGRPAQPSEIAPSYVFLASAEASMFTGQVLHPNAGEILNT